VTLSRFFSKLADQALSFFLCLKKLTKFQWTEQCEIAFLELKRFLTTSPILTKPKSGEELLLYLSVTENALSFVLVKEEGKA